MINVNDVTHEYESEIVFQNTSVEIGSGTTSLFGDNGSGKSTLIELLAGYYSPSAGTVTVLGKNPAREPEVKQTMGILPPNSSPYPNATPDEHMRYVREAKDISPEVDDIALSDVGLESVRDQNTETFSDGMKKRLLLAVAMVGEPEVLLLDEPFAALDEEGVEFVQERLQRRTNDSHCTLVATHDQQAITSYCDRTLSIDGTSISVRE